MVGGGRRAECTLAGRAVFAVGTCALGYPPEGRGRPSVWAFVVGSALDQDAVTSPQALRG